ncbi:glycosyltransferase family 4 protein [Candidatus Villigracilis affinis]|uniref:glycosyltransferase family 4 protein n=1 Tax=Candidatus Villigracilis affinis TaxID=3140682 RepID=UPI002A1F2F65|nr:glycosyltransferase family 4 protein [Anaerolineales bacterium]
MKLIYFSLGYSTHDYRFLKAISDGGHEVFFVQLEGNQRQVESRLVPENVNQVIWKGGREPFKWSNLAKLVRDFRRLVKEIQPDLIHAGPIQTCAFIAILSGFRPVLTMSWGFDLMDDVHKNKWWEWVTGYTLKRSTFFISDANVTRDMAVKYGMNPEKTIVFPWGVDLDHFRMKNAEGRTEQEGFVLFCNRSWETRYGVDVLARAFVKVAQEREDVRLILLGGGSQGAGIRRILQNGGVEEYVTFGGQISQTDLPRWYHMADLYISPSHVDGSSVSLMEALACGLPCLVSDIPANKEWVFENENGWLFRDGDANDLAEKILAAISQREKLPEIGRSSRRSAEMRADWKKNAEALMNVYRSLGGKNAQ